MEGQLDWLWAHAERHNLPAMLLVAHHDLQYVARLAERHPGLKLIIDHLGLNNVKDEAGLGEFDKLLALAKRPWVRVILLGVAVEGFTFYGGFAFTAGRDGRSPVLVQQFRSGRWHAFNPS